MGLCGHFFSEWTNEIRAQKIVPQQKYLISIRAEKNKQKT